MDFFFAKYIISKKIKEDMMVILLTTQSPSAYTLYDKYY